MGKYDKKRWADSSFFFLKAAELSGGTWNVSGLKGIAEHKGPFVYISNHMSMLDTFVLPCLTLAFNDVAYVLKEGLLKYPFFGPILKALHLITVSRHNPRKDFKEVLNKGHDLLLKGYSIIIFPQATRNIVFDAASFNSLGIKLARKAGVLVVPVALKTDFQSNGNIIKEIGIINPAKPIFVKIGDPMAVEGNGQKTHQKVIGFIEDNLKKWGCEVRGV